MSMCGPGWIADLEDGIALGEGGALLIEWADAEQSAELAIETARGELQDRGWDWNPERRQMERDGWYVWFRSQGRLAPPTAQFSLAKGNKS